MVHKHLNVNSYIVCQQEQLLVSQFLMINNNSILVNQIMEVSVNHIHNINIQMSLSVVHQ